MKNSAGEYYCKEHQGAKKRRLVAERVFEEAENEDDDVSDSDDEVLADLAVVPEEAPKPKKKKQVSFEDESYRAWSQFYPEGMPLFLKAMKEAASCTDDQLPTLKSFLVFTMLAAQCDTGLAADVQEKIKQHVSHLPEKQQEAYRQLEDGAKQAFANGILVPLDTFTRSRGKQAGDLYVKLHKDMQPHCTQSQIMATWLVFDIMFRYFGNMEVLKLSVLHPDYYPQLKPYLGNEEEQGLAIVSVVDVALKPFSCLTPLFAPGDGRRRCFPAGDSRVQRHNLASRYLDHVLSAIPFWTAESVKAGQLMEELCTSIQEQQSDQEVFQKCEALMLHMATLTLVGRKQKPGMSFGQQVCSYALKFVFADVLHVVAQTVCEDGRVRKGLVAKSRCPCRGCTATTALRLRYTFTGPSPLALFAQLSSSPVDGGAALEAMYPLPKPVKKQ